MCTTCGCSGDGAVRLTNPLTGHSMEVGKVGHGEAHDHDHEQDYEGGAPHEHEHARDAHVHVGGRVITLEEAVLAKNDRLAERNRGWLAGRSVVALNLVSSPGSGKTTLLERTITDLQSEVPIHVIEADQATVRDAERIRLTGCRVVQINTGAGCHLEADMVAAALRELAPPSESIVMIENVGNLVCPALFDLGERAKVAVLSVTEGEDKPLKYPHMFRAARVMLLNKTDLLPYLRFDVDQCVRHARMVNADLEVFPVSALTGEGMQAWYGWLRSQFRPAE